jgi:arginyl-tRNA synthetase
LRVWRAPKDSGADFTTNAAFLLAQHLKIKPLEAAHILVKAIEDAMAD